MAEIDLIIGSQGIDDEQEPSLLPPLESHEIVTRSGDLWQLGHHRILCDDCRKRSTLLRLMDEKRAQMVITDPPYNVPIDGHVCGNGRVHHDEFAMASGEMTPEEFTEFLTTTLGQFAYFSTDGSLHYVFMDWRHIQELLTAGGEVYDRIINLCVWAKSNGGMGSLYRSQHELVFLFRKGKAAHRNNVALGAHGRYRTNVWNYPGVNSFGKEREEALSVHPTVKPVKLIADAILDVTHRGDIVLDGFLGAGSTLLAAQQTGRACYGVEIDPRHVDIALRRWRKVTGEEPMHVESRQALCELESGNASARETVK